MKKSIHILIALGAATLAGSAVAQDNGNDQAAPQAAVAASVAIPAEAAGAPVPAPDAAGAAAADANANQPVVNQAVADQAPPVDNGAEVAPPDNGQRTSTTIQPTQPLGASRPKVVSRFTPPETAGTNGGPNNLNLNFKNAPIDMVLNYLSDAAGFIIVLDTTVRGTVSVNGKHLTKDEVVDLLNSVLNKNGYAAIREGRTLTIVEKNEAKTRNIPVKTGNDPAGIPNNDEIVTQIIPIRFVDARQLVSDMSSFVSPQATVVANEAGNSIVVTDTQANIKHLAEIIRAVDNSAEAETEIRVFHLKFASPQDVATELASIFPSTGSGGAQTPTRFGGGFGGGGGPGGFFQRMMGGGGGNSGNSSSDRIKKATAVTAVADARIQAVIVTAPKDLMEQIAGMMTDLDVASQRDQKVYVMKLENADPEQAAVVLQGMFQGNNSRTSSSSQNSALQQRAVNNANTTSSSSSSSGFGTSSGGRTGGGRSF